MTKPMLVTLPFVLLLLDYWPLNRFQSGSSRDGNHSIQRPFDFGLLWEKIPLFLLSAVSSVVTYIVQKSDGAVTSLAALPFHDRIANAIVSYGSYIGNMIWPNNLAVFYPYPKSILWWKVAGAGLLLVVVSVVIFRMVRTKPYFAVGWLWYIGTLVPVIGLVQAGSQGMADRYTYVPLIGIFVIIAWGVPDFMPKWRYGRIGFTVTIAAIIAIIMITTRLQIRYWSNSVTLFEHALEVTVDNGTVHAKLGEALAEQGKIDAAVRHYHEALLIKPDFVVPLLNLGVALKEKGELNEAINCFSKVLRTKSNHADAHYELGDTLKRKGDFVGAIKHYLEAIRIKPDRAKTYNSLGVVLALQNKDKEAIIRFYEALRIDPAYAGAYYNLGKVFAKQGKTESAILHFQKALQKDPDMTQALYNLSWIAATAKDDKFRNGIEAIKLAEKLCKLQNYSQPLSLDALAAAYAEAGELDKAVKIARQGLNMALTQGPEELVCSLTKRLRLYQSGLPYRQK
jgi:tetratricopeptide (TPR) repeat protein